MKGIIVFILVVLAMAWYAWDGHVHGHPDPCDGGSTAITRGMFDNC